MKKIALTLLTIATLAVAGCAGLQNKVLVDTVTVVGIHVGQQPSTGMYEAKLGYVRQELAIAPVTTNGITPDIITEFRLSGMFATDGGIYQRMALGATACSQAGAALLFAKGPDGVLNTNVLAKLNFNPVSATTNAIKSTGL